MFATTTYCGFFFTSFTSVKKLRKALKRRGFSFEIQKHYFSGKLKFWVPDWISQEDFDKLSDLIV